MRARTSASASTAGREAGALASRAAARGGRAGPCATSAMSTAPASGVSATSAKPAARSGARPPGSASSAGVGEAQRLAHRDAQRAAVERVAASRVEQQRVDAERRGAAHDGADVRVVVDVLEHDDAARAAHELGDARQRLAVERGEHAAVHGEARDRAHQLVARGVHGHALGREAAEALHALLEQQQRAHAVAEPQRALDHELALGDEDAVARAVRAPRRAGAAWRRAGARTRARAGREGRPAPCADRRRLPSLLWGMNEFDRVGALAMRHLRGLRDRRRGALVHARGPPPRLHAVGREPSDGDARAARRQAADPASPRAARRQP